MEEEQQSRLLARFALDTNFSDLAPDIVDQLKKHLLDALGSLIHATERPTILKLTDQIKALGGGGNIPVPILGATTVDRAAQLYTALIRYPDFMDNFLGKESTCHPSDNIGSLLAVAEQRESSGKDFLTAMALGYEIECRLIEEIPVMIKGFDHTLLLAYSITAALAPMLSLTEEQAAHAIAMAGSTFDPLAVCRASYTYEWKGLMSSFVAFGCMNLALLAKQGMTGPISIFNGPKGFDEVFGMKLKYDWEQEDFSLIRRCALKSYNSEVHTQAAVEAALDLKRTHQFRAEDIDSIDVKTFLTCYDIVGGGAYGDRQNVHSKEQADHSMFYVIAAALLDDQVYPAQLLTERINSEDVQALLQKVNVHTTLPIHSPEILAGAIDPYMMSYPDKVKSKVEIKLKDGRKLAKETEDFHGYYTRPLSWTDTETKFRKLAEGVINPPMQERIIEVVRDLERRNMKELTGLISTFGLPKLEARA